MVHQVAAQGTARSAARSREWARSALMIAGVLGIYFIAPFGQHDDPLPLATAVTLSVVVAVGLAVLVGRRIIAVFRGTSSVGLPALLTLLVVVAVAFAAANFLLVRSDPTQVTGLRTRLDGLYFTLTTVFTVGYGDIAPAGQAARALASLQFLFNGILVTGLVRAILHQAKADRVTRGR